jgi:hypothetical protein
MIIIIPIIIKYHYHNDTHRHPRHPDIVRITNYRLRREHIAVALFRAVLNTNTLPASISMYQIESRGMEFEWFKHELTISLQNAHLLSGNLASGI